MKEVLVQLRKYFDFSTVVTPLTNLKEVAMKYLLLCQYQPTAFDGVSQESMAQLMQDMMSFNQQLIQAGVLLAGGQLAPPETAQRVFTANGHIKTQDGPALAGDTQIGGYYLIDVACEPQATGWAAKCPAAAFGALEVRQVAYSPL
jgi:hypothetical protein